MDQLLVFENNIEVLGQEEPVELFRVSARVCYSVLSIPHLLFYVPAWSRWSVDVGAERRAGVEFICV